jgi:hypothetical protein
VRAQIVTFNGVEHVAQRRGVGSAPAHLRFAVGQADAGQDFEQPA